jgi:hypothetical protein
MSASTSTAEVIDRFNRAFLEHDGELLIDLVAEDCVMESVDPAPDGTRYEGRRACLSFWHALAIDPNSSFTPEAVAVYGDRAIIRWRYRFGDSSVRGVNLMHVRNGEVIEALGYVKSGEAAVAGALNHATGGCPTGL